MSCTPCLQLQPIPRGSPRYRGNSIELAGVAHETMTAISVIADAMETIGSRFFPARITGPATAGLHPFVEQYYTQGFRADLSGGRYGPSREATVADIDFTDQPVLMEESIDPATGIKTYSFIGTAGSIPSLDSIGDVAIDTPAEDDVLQYNDVTDQWENVSISDFGDTLNLTDIIDATSLTTGDMIYYDGVNWVNTTVDDFLTANLTTFQTFLGDNISINNLGDINITSVANGDVLVYDSGSSTWINTPGSTFSMAGDELWLFAVTGVMYHRGSHTTPANAEVATWFLPGMVDITDNNDGSFDFEPLDLGLDDADHAKETTNGGSTITIWQGAQGAGVGGGGAIDQTIWVRVTANNAGTIIGGFDLRSRAFSWSMAIQAGTVADVNSDANDRWGSGGGGLLTGAFTNYIEALNNDDDYTLSNMVLAATVTITLIIDGATGKLKLAISGYASELQIMIRVIAGEQKSAPDVTIS